MAGRSGKHRAVVWVHGALRASACVDFYSDLSFYSMSTTELSVTRGSTPGLSVAAKDLCWTIMFGDASYAKKDNQTPETS